MLFASSFLHFYDTHFLDEMSILSSISPKNIHSEIDIATRIALIYSDSIYIPISSYYESDVCRSVVDKYSKDGVPWSFVFCSNAISVSDYIDEKKDQYSVGSRQHEIYRDAKPAIDICHVKKKTNTTTFISNRMQQLLTSGDVPGLFNCARVSLPKDIESRWEKIPEILGDKAYIPSYVAFGLFGDTKNHQLVAPVHNVVNRSYFNSYLQDIEPTPAIVTNMKFMYCDYMNNNNGYEIPYRYVYSGFVDKGLARQLTRGSVDTLKKLRVSDEVRIIFLKAIEMARRGLAAQLLHYNQQNGGIGSVVNNNTVNNYVVGNSGTTTVTSSNTINTGIDSANLISDIDRLVEHLRKKGGSSDVEALLGAREEISEGREPSMLKKVTLGAFAVAKEIGTSVLSEVISKQLGLS